MVRGPPNLMGIGHTPVSSLRGREKRCPSPGLIALCPSVRKALRFYRTHIHLHVPLNNNVQAGLPFVERRFPGGRAEEPPGVGR